MRMIMFLAGILIVTPAMANEAMSRRIQDLMKIPSKCELARLQTENLSEIIPPAVFRKSTNETTAYLILKWEPLEKDKKGLVLFSRLAEEDKAPGKCKTIRLIWSLDNNNLDVGIYGHCEEQFDGSNYHKESGYYYDKEKQVQVGEQHLSFWNTEVERIVSEGGATLSKCK